MDSFMIYVSYYYDRDPAVSTYYSVCSKKLKEQLDLYNCKNDFQYIDFVKEGLNSTYLKLNMIKPSFLLQKLEQHNTPVVWIDADCILKEKLYEFETIESDIDIAYCIRHHDNKTPHAAILYFGNTDNAKQFLKDWEAINKIKEKDDSYICSEHCTLIDLLEKTKIPLKKKEFKNLAHSGVYDMGNRIIGPKIWIGISPDAWEFEKSKFK
jgi:hypothetical protein